MVEGSCPAHFSDGNNGRYRISLGHGNRRELFVICSGGTANCSRGWHFTDNDLVDVFQCGVRVNADWDVGT